MLTIKDIKVRAPNLKALEISWSVDSTFEDILEYDTYVLRAGAPYGPYEEVIGPLKDKYLYTDPVSLMDRSKVYYYRIKIVKEEDSEEFPSDTGIFLSATPDPYGMEMARIYNLQLYINTRKVVLYPRRRFGQRCVECWDKDTKRRIKSGCETCYDTSWVGGFHSPVILPVEIVETGVTAPKGSQLGSYQMKHGKGRLGNLHLITENDVIIEGENTRWKVVEGSVKNVQKHRALIRQEFDLVQIPHGDVEYRLPVPDDFFENMDPPNNLMVPMDINYGAGGVL